MLSVYVPFQSVGSSRVIVFRDLDFLVAYRAGNSNHRFPGCSHRQMLPFRLYILGYYRFGQPDREPHEHEEHAEADNIIRLLLRSSIHHQTTSLSKSSRSPPAITLTTSLAI